MQDDFDVAAFERATKRNRVISVTIALLVLSSPLLYVVYGAYREHHARNVREEEYRKSQELSDSERSELRRLLSTSKATVAEASAAWTKAVMPDALRALEVTEGGCAVEIDAPTIGAGNSYAQYGSIDLSYNGGAGYTMYPSATAIGAAPALAGVDAALADIADKLEHDDATKDDLDRARRALAPDHTIFIVGQRTEPVVLADSYLPGTLAGTAYVYDFASRRVVCMGAIEARNSPSIEINYTYNELSPLDKDVQAHSSAMTTLGRDLDVEIRRALASRMHGAQ